MGVEIFLNFENDSGIFMPGQMMTGSVTLNTSSTEVITGSTLSFIGEGIVRWNETERRESNPNPNAIYPQVAKPQPPPHFNTSTHFQNVDYVVREYGNQETYLNYSMKLPIGDGESFDSDDGLELPEGYHKIIPFNFQLPSGLPSSCTMTCGNVKYFVEASLNVKSSGLLFNTNSNRTSKREFFITGCLDLTFVHNALKPFNVRIRDEFETGFCCCSSVDGDLELNMFLARFGFIPGEAIVFQLDYTNTSSHTIKNMKAFLIQTITYITFGKERSEVFQLATSEFNSQILPDSQGTWTSDLNLPQTAYLTDLGGCRIIRVRYKLLVTAKPSMFRKTKMEIPLTVGTMPVTC